MDTAEKIRGQAKVVVELAPFLRRFAALEENEGQAFTNYLLQHLNELVADLALPTEVSLEIGSNEDEHTFDITSYRVQVNDYKCRFSLPTIVPQDVSALELARSVAQAIYQNRELWVTLSLAEQVLKKWLSGEEKGGANGFDFLLNEFHTFLLELIRRCFRIDKGKKVVQALQAKGQDGWNAMNMFEDAISSWDAIGISIFLGAAQYNILLSDDESAETQSGTDDESEKAQSRANDEYIEELFHNLQDDYQRELGVFVPKMKVRTDESLDANEFRIQLNDLRFPSIRGLGQGQFLVGCTVNELAAVGVVGKRAINPLTNSECSLIQGEENAVTCQKARFSIRIPSDLLRQCIVDQITRNAGAYLTTDIVKYNLDLLQQMYPALLESVIHHFDVIKLTRIFRNLLDERLSVRDLLPILEALIAINGTTAIDLSKYKVLSPTARNMCPVTKEKKVEDVDATEYSDYLRVAFKRYVSYQHTMGSNVLYAYRLDAQIETRIANITSRPLNDEEHHQLMKAIFDETQKPKSISADPVLLTEYALRKSLRSVIEKEYPWLAVMCYQELSPYVDIQIIGQILWKEKTVELT